MPEVAVPVPASAYSTVTCLWNAALRLTVKVMLVVPLSPSVALAEPMDRVGSGVSSSVIVPVPVPTSSRALKESPLNATSTVSSDSASVSPCTASVTVLRVCPGLKVSLTRGREQFRFVV